MATLPGVSRQPSSHSQHGTTQKSQLSIEDKGVVFSDPGLWGRRSRVVDPLASYAYDYDDQGMPSYSARAHSGQSSSSQTTSSNNALTLPPIHKANDNTSGLNASKSNNNGQKKVQTSSSSDNTKSKTLPRSSTSSKGQSSPPKRSQTTRMAPQAGTLTPYHNTYNGGNKAFSREERQHLHATSTAYRHKMTLLLTLPVHPDPVPVFMPPTAEEEHKLRELRELERTRRDVVMERLVSVRKREKEKKDKEQKEKEDKEQEEKELREEQKKEREEILKAARLKQKQQRKEEREKREKMLHSIEENKQQHRERMVHLQKTMDDARAKASQRKADKVSSNRSRSSGDSQDGDNAPVSARDDHVPDSANVQESVDLNADDSPPSVTAEEESFTQEVDAAPEPHDDGEVDVAPDTVHDDVVQEEEAEERGDVVEVSEPVNTHTGEDPPVLFFTEPDQSDDHVDVEPAVESTLDLNVTEEPVGADVHTDTYTTTAPDDAVEATPAEVTDTVPSLDDDADMLLDKPPVLPSKSLVADTQSETPVLASNEPVIEVELTPAPMEPVVDEPVLSPTLDDDAELNLDSAEAPPPTQPLPSVGDLGDADMDMGLSLGASIQDVNEPDTQPQQPHTPTLDQDLVLDDLTDGLGGLSGGETTAPPQPADNVNEEVVTGDVASTSHVMDLSLNDDLTLTGAETEIETEKEAEAVVEAHVEPSSTAVEPEPVKDTLADLSDNLELVDELELPGPGDAAIVPVMTEPEPTPTGDMDLVLTPEPVVEQPTLDDGMDLDLDDDLNTQPTQPLDDGMDMDLDTIEDLPNINTQRPQTASSQSYDLDFNLSDNLE